VKHGVTLGRKQKGAINMSATRSSSRTGIITRDIRLIQGQKHPNLRQFGRFRAVCVNHLRFGAW